MLKESSALFQCRLAAGIPTPRVTWSRVGGPLPANAEEIQGGVTRFNRVSGSEKGTRTVKLFAIQNSNVLLKA